MKTQRRDANGSPVVVGAMARIPAIPHWLLHDLPEEDVAELRRCEGTWMEVLEIDAHGYVWFAAKDGGRWFCLKPEEIEMVTP